MIYSIQSKTHITSGSTASTLSATLDQTPTKGNVLVATIATYNGYGNIDASVNTITQTGITWNCQVKNQTVDKVFDIEIWTGKVTSTSASQNLTITLYNATSQGIIAEVFEYNGISEDISAESFPSFGSGYEPLSGYTFQDESHELIVGATFAYYYQQNAPINGFTLYDGQYNGNLNSLGYLELKSYSVQYPPTTVSTGTHCVDPGEHGIRPWIGCIAAFKKSQLIPDDYNCASNQPEGVAASKGITLWGANVTNNYHMAANGGTATIRFTGTHPKGYTGRAVCNITWDYEIDSSSNQQDVRIGCTLNGYSIGERIHSKIYGHNVTETLDLAPFGDPGWYNDDNTNTLIFTNNNDVGVSIKNLRIVRVYSVYDYAHTWAPAEEVRPPSTDTGSIDSQREDYPCSCENCGNPYSFTTFGPDSSQGYTLESGASKSWTFVIPPSKQPSNYMGLSSCFFNFNNLIVKTNSGSNDNQYTISLNGNTIATFYQTRQVDNPPTLYTTQAVSVDLAKAQGYHDEPGASNTVTLTNNSGARMELIDGSPSDPGRINIYRVYRTTNNWQDTFNDNSIDTSFWETLAANGGTATETSNKLQVSIPSGSGWAQAGYVSKYYHNVQQKYGYKQGFTASLDVSTNTALDQMGLLICNTKVSGSDPYSENNWYRIVKGRRCNGTNVLAIENRIGGTWASKWNVPWSAATGNLKMATSLGSVAFYESGTMKYAEPYALPSQDCYVYAYASSERSVASGTGYFDNFEVTPANSFVDTFEDGNYDGWTSDAGSWQLSSGVLLSNQSNSYMHTNSTFSTNRHVKANMRTLSPTGSAADALRLYVSMIDGYNNIYAVIRRDNYVELTVWSGGTRYYTEALANKNPLADHTVAVSIIGTNAKVWVDGTLYINWDNAVLDDVTNGHVGISTFNSTGYFDNIVVLSE
ncbi:MAG: hypothetical protein ACQCN5_07275 [Candidatus Bathyarchaeia archaeon]